MLPDAEIRPEAARLRSGYCYHFRSRVGDGAMTSEPLTDRSEWFGVLADLLDLRFDRTPPEARDRLWDRALATHRAWDAAGRP